MRFFILGFFVIFWGGSVGYLEAKDDADTIARGRPIDHASGLKELLGIGIVSVLLLWSIALKYGASAWSFFSIAAVWSASLAISFRASLNGLRRKPFFYVSGSNAYDTFFIRWFGRGAGHIATLFEATVLAAGILFGFWMRG